MERTPYLAETTAGALALLGLQFLSLPLLAAGLLLFGLGRYTRTRKSKPAPPM